tara:strand:- start:74 stop:229 length:156 start_codon:yes stop_codon:yes gene_type:complete
MVEENKKKSYYQRNKKHYQKGGKYYKYKSVEERRPKIPMRMKHGTFILCFD